MHSSSQDSSGNIGNRACIVKHASASHDIGVHLVISLDKKISGFSVHTIPDSWRIQKFPLWSADLKSGGLACWIHRKRVDKSHVQKELAAV